MLTGTCVNMYKLFITLFLLDYSIGLDKIACNRGAGVLHAFTMLVMYRSASADVDRHRESAAGARARDERPATLA